MLIGHTTFPLFCFSLPRFLNFSNPPFSLSCLLQQAKLDRAAWEMELVTKRSIKQQKNKRRPKMSGFLPNPDYR